MLKFFRRIRKKMIEQSKVRSYVLYAIGEIFLVVIGILIALQINNWNEVQKDRASEVDILHNLNEELIRNKEELEIYQQIHLEGYQDGLFLLSLFNSDVSAIPNSRLDSVLAGIESGYTFEAIDGYIESIIVSGNISLIQNVELKSLLTSFDGAVIDATQETEIIQRLNHERLWPAIDGKISSSNRLRYYEGFSDFPPGTYQSDYTWFFNNREMEDVVSNIVSWQKNVVDDEKLLQEHIERMIYLIENELEN
jgi:hypothetical protein